MPVGEMGDLEAASFPGLTPDNAGLRGSCTIKHREGREREKVRENRREKREEGRGR
jgi:hypothetical protein